MTCRTQLVAVGIIAAVLGCNPLDEARIDELRDGSAGDGFIGATDMADPIDMGGPRLKRPPARPSVDDGASGPDVTFALRELGLDQRGDAWRTIGYDLDDLNTTPSSPQTECVPPADGASIAYDGVDGIDNNFGAELYPLFELALGDWESQIRQAMLEGRGTILLTVAGWSGETDDPRVDVLIAQSIDGTSAALADVRLEAGELVQVTDSNPAPEPEWDGGDSFVPGDRFFLGGDPSRPLLRDDNAYVAGGRLVARLPGRTELVFETEAAATVLQLVDGLLVGELSSDRQGFDDVTIAGRWLVTDLLSDASHMGICVGTPERSIFANQTESVADVVGVPGSGGDEVDCDALSVGLTLNGSRAVRGVPGPSPAVPNPCE